MYAFGPIPRQKHSGRVIGTHQKIDRVARRHLSQHLSPELWFPSIKDILHFEGSRGPDGIKMKSPGRDEPWHFIDPDNIQPNDVLLVAIRDHSENLTQALLDHNEERAAFEAAWLAHAVADGLTPAHHDSYKEQVDAIGGSDHIQKKIYGVNMIVGGGKRDLLRNNWKYWGAKGVVTTHALFEAGIAAAAKPLTFQTARVELKDMHRLSDEEFESIYIDMIGRIHRLGMYQEFKQHGWTRSLAQATTRELLPTVIKAVTLAWCHAYDNALERQKS